MSFKLDANSHKIGRIDTATCWFFICDMQKDFTPSFYPEILDIASRLIQAASILNIPIICSEHEGFGKTRSELDLAKATIFTKTKYSMFVPEIQKILGERPIAKTVVLFGITTHCCILQTCLDLLVAGYEVHVISDAVSSDRLIDSFVAIERMRNSGAYIDTSESLFWELIRGTDHPAHDKFCELIKDPLPDMSQLTYKFSM